MTHKPMLKHVPLSFISPIKAILSSCALYAYVSVRKYPCRKSRRFGGAEQWNQGSSSMLDAAWEETLASSNARSPRVTGSGIRATTPSMACMADDYVRTYIRAVVGSILSSASLVLSKSRYVLLILLLLLPTTTTHTSTFNSVQQSRNNFYRFECFSIQNKVTIFSTTLSPFYVISRYS